MMRVNRYVWMCEDCLQPAVNNEWSGLDYHYGHKEAEARAKIIKRGLRKLGPHLVPAFDSEASPDSDDQEHGFDTDFTEPCECCGRAGLRCRKGYRFAILVTASSRYAAAHAAVKGALSYMDGCSLDDEGDRRRVLGEIMERLHAAKLA